MKTKFCPKCQENKRFSKFYYCSSTKSKLMYYCKTCSSEICKTWYQKNRERCLNTSKRWQKDNPEQYKMVAKRYQEKNKEAIALKRNTPEYKEYFRQYGKEYYRKNKQRWQTIYKEKRAKITQSLQSI